MVASSSLYRGFVSVDRPGTCTDVTVFAVAPTRADACDLMLSATRRLYPYQDHDAFELYNIYELADLIAENVSDDIALRAFESGWTGGKPIYLDDSRPILVAGSTNKTVPRAVAEQLVRGFVAVFHAQDPRPESMPEGER